MTNDIPSWTDSFGRQIAFGSVNQADLTASHSFTPVRYRLLQADPIGTEYQRLNYSYGEGSAFRMRVLSSIVRISSSSLTRTARWSRRPRVPVDSSWRALRPRRTKPVLASPVRTHLVLSWTATMRPSSPSRMVRDSSTSNT